MVRGTMSIRQVFHTDPYGKDLIDMLHTESTSDYVCPKSDRNRDPDAEHTPLPYNRP